MMDFYNKEELRKMISRYLEGEATAEEVVFLEKYYEYFRDENDGLESLTEEEQDHLKTELLHRIQDQLPLKKQQKSIVTYLQVAAALVLLLVVGGVFWKVQSPSEQEEVFVTGSEESFSWISDTSVLQEKHVYLPDGSYVKMEPGTRIQYREDFYGDLREVKLSGTAFFDVQRDSLHPFVVEAEGISTRVLGTSFSISSPDESDEFSITVTEGKVEVASGSSPSMEILEKNDQLMLNRRTQKLTKMKLRKEKTAQFVPAEYIMDDMTVFNAIEIVEKW